MSLLQFNINQHVRVKLLPAGFVHWKADYDRVLPATLQKPLEYYQAKAGKDGYVDFQMWQFIELFGPVTHIGVTLLYDTNILFRQEDLMPAHEPTE